MCKALDEMETGNSTPLCPDSHCSVPRTPQEESRHHCPQLEALQQKLRMLEEENDQLREEVKTWEEGRPRAVGDDGPAPSSLPPSRPLNWTPWRMRSRCSSWNVWSSFVRDFITWAGGCLKEWREEAGIWSMET